MCRDTNAVVYDLGADSGHGTEMAGLHRRGCPVVERVGHQGDGPAFLSLGRDVADAEAVGAAGESAVGEQRAILPQAGTHDGARGRQHLRHPGPALGALVPDHYHRPLQPRSTTPFETG